jgi:hypothetical protein
MKVLVGKPERKRPLGGHGYRWEGNIRMDLREICSEVWTLSSISGEGPVVAFCEHGNEPLGSRRVGEFLDLLSDSKLLYNDSVSWS